MWSPSGQRSGGVARPAATRAKAPGTDRPPPPPPPTPVPPVPRQAIAALARTNVHFAGLALGHYVEAEMLPAPDAPVQARALRHRAEVGALLRKRAQAGRRDGRALCYGGLVPVWAPWRLLIR